MAVTIKIEHSHIIVLVAILTLFSGAYLVHSFGTSNPAVFGHSAGELVAGTLQGNWTFNGTVEASEFIPTSGSGLNCSTQLGNYGLVSTVTCPVDTTLTGGGCTSGSSTEYYLTQNYPSNTTTWYCTSADSANTARNAQAYAVCCTFA